MTEKEVITYHSCGPSTESCKCECADGGDCEHKWDGKELKMSGVYTTTCSRCGMPAIDHSLWVGIWLSQTTTNTNRATPTWKG